MRKNTLTRNAVILTALLILLFCIVACGTASQESSTDESVTSTHDPTDSFAFAYSYSWIKSGAEVIDTNDLDGDLLLFHPSVSELDDDIYFSKNTTASSQPLTSFSFFGTERDVIYIKSKTMFPMFPIEYGSYSIYSIAPSSDDSQSGLVYIRDETGEPIRFVGKDTALFQDLNLESEDDVLAFSYEILSRFGNLTGYTPTVFAGRVEGSYEDGIGVEYNLMIDGYPTNCYVQMILGYDKESYEITLSNDIEDVIAPYRDLDIDSERIQSMIESKIIDACLFTDYQFHGFEAENRLMVLDDKLKVHSVVTVQMTAQDKETKVVTPPIYTLIEVGGFTDSDSDHETITTTGATQTEDTSDAEYYFMTVENFTEAPSDYYLDFRNFRHTFDPDVEEEPYFTPIMATFPTSVTINGVSYEIDVSSQQHVGRTVTFALVDAPTYDGLVEPKVSFDAVNGNIVGIVMGEDLSSALSSENGAAGSRSEQALALIHAYLPHIDLADYVLEYDRVFTGLGEVSFGLKIGEYQTESHLRVRYLDGMPVGIYAIDHYEYEDLDRSLLDVDKTEHEKVIDSLLDYVSNGMRIIEKRYVSTTVVRSSDGRYALEYTVRMCVEAKNDSAARDITVARFYLWK